MRRRLVANSAAVALTPLQADSGTTVERSAPRSHPTTRAWRRIRRSPLALASLIFFTLVVLFAYSAPVIAAYVTKQDYQSQDLAHPFLPPGTTTAAFDFSKLSQGPISRTHALGTDELGRDVLTRLAYGGRISLSVAFLSVLLALSIGLFVGAVAGYYGGRVDATLMRCVDVLLSIPSLFILILISTTLNNDKLLTKTLFYRQASWIVLPLVIASISWTGASRLVRGEFLAIREREYVLAARVVGATDRHVILRHILPNVTPVIIIWATLQVPSLILTEASLSYLGFGVQIPTPSWGNMLADATEYFTRAPYLILLPGIAIYLTTLSIYLVGASLRDALDPRLKN